MNLSLQLTALADAIRAKTGGTEKMTIAGMTSAVGSIEAGGDSSYCLEFLNAFFGTKNFKNKTIDLDSLTNDAGLDSYKIPYYLFADCTNLYGVLCRNASYMASYSFRPDANYPIEFIDALNVTSMASQALPVKTTGYIVGYVSIPNVTGSYSSNIGMYRALGISDFKLGSSYGVYSDVIVSKLSNVPNIKSNTMKSLILCGEYVATLSNIDYFLNNLQSGIGYVYVPESQYGSYCEATNWSYLASRIRKLEDFPVYKSLIDAYYADPTIETLKAVYNHDPESEVVS